MCEKNEKKAKNKTEKGYLLIDFAIFLFFLNSFSLPFLIFFIGGASFAHETNLDNRLTLTEDLPSTSKKQKKEEKRRKAKRKENRSKKENGRKKRVSRKTQSNMHQKIVYFLFL